MIARLSLSGSSFSDTAMTGKAVVIIVPSNWCMNCAQPTMSGTMTEKRDGDGEAIGTVLQDARRPRKRILEHGQRHLLARRREGVVEFRELVRREGDVVGRAVRSDMRRLHRLRDRDHARPVQ